MPLYDYACKEESCGKTFEVICKVSEIPDVKVCPHCQSKNTEKFLGGAPAIGDSVRLGIRRIDNGFREVLQKIDERTVGSKLKDNIR